MVDVEPADDVLVFEGDKFGNNARGRVSGADAGVKAGDADIADEHGALVVGVAEVEADDALAVAGADVDVADAALVVGIETRADGTGIALAGVEGEVAQTVLETLGRGGTRPDDLARIGGVLEAGGAILEFDHGAVGGLALEKLTAGGASIGAPPLEFGGDEVSAIGEIDRAFAIEERLLNGSGVIGDAIALGAVVAPEVGDIGVGGVADVFGQERANPCK